MSREKYDQWKSSIGWNLKRSVFLLMIAIMFGAVIGTPDCFARKSVAIMDFDFAAIQKWWEGDWNIGKGIPDILMSKMFESGNFDLVDRKQLETVMAEQDRSNTDRFDPTTAAKLGKLVGADYIVVGSITQFGTENKNSGGAGAILGKQLGILGGLGVSNSKAKVVITARMIDVNTGVIKSVAQGKGESKRTGLMVFGGEFGSGGAMAGGGGSMPSGFRETILGEATDAACDDVAGQLAYAIDPENMPKKAIYGDILDINKKRNEITNSLGSEAGIKVGAIFEIKRVVDTIKNKEKTKVLREIMNIVGKIEITEVGQGYSVGKIVEGKDFRTSDRAVPVE